METNIRKVVEIDAADRIAIEHLIGGHLTEHQQIIISVVDIDRASPDPSGVPAAAEVPAWWNIYEGLSDEETDQLDQAIHPRANLTRAVE